MRFKCKQIVSLYIISKLKQNKEITINTHIFGSSYKKYYISFKFVYLICLGH